MREHLGLSSVQEQGCGVLWSVADGDAACKRAVVEAGGAASVAAMQRAHPQLSDVAKRALELLASTAALHSVPAALRQKNQQLTQHHQHFGPLADDTRVLLDGLPSAPAAAWTDLCRRAMQSSQEFRDKLVRVHSVEQQVPHPSACTDAHTCPRAFACLYSYIHFCSCFNALVRSKRQTYQLSSQLALPLAHPLLASSSSATRAPVPRSLYCS